MYPTLTKRQKDKLRFCILLECLDFHRTTFQYDLIQEIKFKFNNFFNHFNSLRKALLGNMPDAAKEYLDDMGATVWEVLDELDQAKDKKELLAMMKAYNKGELVVADEAEYNKLLTLNNK